MVVQFILKGLFFYFLFLFVRSFFRSAKEVNQKPASGPGSKRTKQSNKSEEDIVEAEFRRL
ncbi:MAG: hypothetical protein NXH75_16190 [Halobacteriovoraceae bacterium]|nr:hypothetical protein [Halobacteriovoraceae bacterium]